MRRVLIIREAKPMALSIKSVRERINEVIDAELVSGIGILRRVPLVVRVLPAIAHIGIPVDQDHDSAVVIHNRIVRGVVHAGLSKALAAAPARYHLWSIDIIKRMVYLMAGLKFDHFPVGKNLGEISIESIPLLLPPEIINQHKSSPQQIFP